MVETQTQTQKEMSPEEKAKDFLTQLGVIGQTVDTLQVEVEKLLTKRLNPNTDAGRLVRTIQRLQQILRKDFTSLEFTVKEQGGFRLWVEDLLKRRN